MFCLGIKFRRYISIVNILYPYIINYNIVVSVEFRTAQRFVCLKCSGRLEKACVLD